MCQGRFKEIMKVFQEVFCCMVLIAASRSEGGLIYLVTIPLRVRQCVPSSGAHLEYVQCSEHLPD